MKPRYSKSNTFFAYTQPPVLQKGHHNSIFVFRDQPLVVVITATAYGAMYGHSQVDKMMENYILPAVVK
jgi:hypothetical protein